MCNGRVAQGEKEEEEDGRMGEGWVIQRLIGHVLFLPDVPL